MRHSKLMVLLLALLSSPASAEVYGRFHIQNVSTGQFLTAEGNAKSLQWTYEPVVLRPLAPKGKREAQTWTFERPPGMDENLHGYWLWNQLSGRVLDTNKDGLATSHPVRSSIPGTTQRWELRWGNLRQLGISGTWPTGAPCLDAYYDGKSGYGPTVGAWRCHGTDRWNQQWVLIKADE